MLTNAEVAAVVQQSQKTSEVLGNCFDHASHEGGARDE